MGYETKLAGEYTKYFAFAEEKLEELKELSALADQEDYKADEIYQNNAVLFAGDRDCENADVKKVFPV